MSVGMFHGLSKAVSMDLPEKKLRNTTWGVFKAFVFFFLLVLG